ncbi:MAG: hypothetical protein IKV48_08485 [Eggerthellaceae bacterium]|nr:hypothetical protein [Eggerthellaceae bacterium]
MGQRFQVYASYGKQDEPGKPGDNLFAMHLQWCWGPYAIIRAHQLTSFLDGAKENAFNPFGLGELSRVGGTSFDGRREDLYLLRALTEINNVSASIVEGHDLMAEEHNTHKWRFEQNKITSIPSTIKVDPLAQDNDDGWLVVQATPSQVKYAFCRDVSAIRPVRASAYMKEYSNDMDGWPTTDRVTVEAMVEDLDQRPLLTKSEIEQIFEREYSKSLNIEGYREPDKKLIKQKPLDDVVKEAKERAEKQRESPDSQLKGQDNKKHHDQMR